MAAEEKGSELLNHELNKTIGLLGLLLSDAEAVWGTKNGEVPWNSAAHARRVLTDAGWKRNGYLWTKDSKTYYDLVL